MLRKIKTFLERLIRRHDKKEVVETERKIPDLCIQLRKTKDDSWKCAIIITGQIVDRTKVLGTLISFSEPKLYPGYIYKIYHKKYMGWITYDPTRKPDKNPTKGNLELVGTLMVANVKQIKPPLNKQPDPKTCGYDTGPGSRQQQLIDVVNSGKWFNVDIILFGQTKVQNVNVFVINDNMSINDELYMFYNNTDGYFVPSEFVNVNTFEDIQKKRSELTHQVSSRDD